MKSLFLASAALLATLFVGVSAEAGFFGEAYLNVYNARIEVADSSDPSGWRKAVAGTSTTDLDNGDIDLRIKEATSSDTGVRARLNGSPFDEQDDTVSFPSSAAPDSEAAYVGTGGPISNNSAFSSQGVAFEGTSYSLGDSTGVDDRSLVSSGTIGSSTDPGDSDVSLIVSSLLTSNFETSSASSTVGTNARIDFDASVGSKFRLVFNYDAALVLDLISSPPDFASGSVAYQIGVTGNGGLNPVANGVGDVVTYGDPGLAFSGAPFISDELVLSGTGSIVGGFFDISRSVSLKMAAVPEPSTLAVFGLSALGLCAAGYRRRRNA